MRTSIASNCNEKNTKEMQRRVTKAKRDNNMAQRRSWKGKMHEIGGQLQPRRKDAEDLLTFDFQQNLTTPNLTHQDMLYAGQMWTYNFGVHNCLANNRYMFKPFALHLQKISIHLCPNLFHYEQDARELLWEIIALSCCSKPYNEILVPLRQLNVNGIVLCK